MKKQIIVWSLIGGGSVVVAVIAVFFILGMQRGDPIKIGAVIAMSGPASHLVDVRDGMQMAIDEVNNWGGVNGRDMELVVRDSQSEPEVGKRAFEAIEEKNHPLLYVSTNSNVSMGLAPLAKKNRVVLVGLVVSTGKFTPQSEWIYKYYTMPEDETRTILYILDMLKIRKLGILYQDEEYGISILSALKKGFENAGGSVVSVPFPIRNPDWKALISRMRDTEAVFVVGYLKNEEAAIGALKEAKYKGSILGASGVTNLAGRPEMDGVYVAAPLIYNSNFPFAREVKEKYESVYKKPFTHQAASGYDLIKLLAGLLGDREVSREGVRRLLDEGFVYPGIFGELDIRPGTRDITIPLHPARIAGEKIQFLR